MSIKHKRPDVRANREADKVKLVLRAAQDRYQMVPKHRDSSVYVNAPVIVTFKKSIVNWEMITGIRQFHLGHEYLISWFPFAIYELSHPKLARIKNSISIHLYFRLTNGVFIDVSLAAYNIFQYVAKGRYEWGGHKLMSDNGTATSSLEEQLHNSNIGECQLLLVRCCRTVLLQISGMRFRTCCPLQVADCVAQHVICFLDCSKCGWLRNTSSANG